MRQGGPSGFASTLSLGHEPTSTHREEDQLPDHRQHRGPHPEDARLFATETGPALTQGVEELSWLLSRGYSDNGALKLVGDRHKLCKRQRDALLRCACSEQACALRRSRRLSPEKLVGRPLAIDGFNLLISAECWLSGGVLFKGRDGLLRDLASVHGSYRAVLETRPSLQRIMTSLSTLQAGSLFFWFDQPVSNSGRVAGWVRQELERAGLCGEVACVSNPDRQLAESNHVVVTSDGWVLDHAAAHFDLLGLLMRQADAPSAWLVDLSGSRLRSSPDQGMRHRP